MSLTFPVQVRRVLTLLLLVWHVPEAILIATQGMGISPRHWRDGRPREPTGGEGAGRAHGQVPSPLACLREAATAKAGGRGVG